MMLHRECLPFVPLRTSYPSGPQGSKSPGNHEPHFGFWQDSARTLFKSAADLMSLMRNCQDRDALLETPAVGFAVYMTAFLGVYAINWPHMDQDGYMSSSPDQSSRLAGVGTKGQEETRTALEMIAQMRPRLRMAESWFRTLHRMHRLFVKAKSHYRRHATSLAGSGDSHDGANGIRPSHNRRDSSLQMADESKLLAKLFQDYGNPADEGTPAAKPYNQSQGQFNADYEDTASSHSTHDLNSESGSAMDGMEGQPPNRQDKWIAINSAVNALAAADSERPSHPPSRLSDAEQQLRAAAGYGNHQPSSPPSQQQQQQQQLQRSDSYAIRDPPSNAHSIHNILSPQPNALHSLSPPNVWPRANGHSSLAQLSQSSYPTPQSQPPSAAAYPSEQQTSLPPFNAQSQSQHPQQHQQHQQPQAQAQPQQHQQDLPLHPAGASSSTAADTTNGHLDDASKEAWLESLMTKLDGEDVAAFMDGVSHEEWAASSARLGRKRGWLGVVWGSGEA